MPSLWCWARVHWSREMNSHLWIPWIFPSNFYFRGAQTWLSIRTNQNILKNSATWAPLPPRLSSSGGSTTIKNFKFPRYSQDASIVNETTVYPSVLSAQGSGSLYIYITQILFPVGFWLQSRLRQLDTFDRLGREKWFKARHPVGAVAYPEGSIHLQFPGYWTGVGPLCPDHWTPPEAVWSEVYFTGGSSHLKPLPLALWSTL